MRKARKKTTTKKTTKKRGLRPGAKAWTATEVKRLTTLYKTKTAREIAKTLRRSLPSVSAKINALGLKKPAVRKAATKKTKKVVRRKATPKRKTVARKKATPKRKTATRKKVARKKTTKKRGRR